MSEIIEHIKKASRSPFVILLLLCFAVVFAGVALGLYLYHRQSIGAQTQAQLESNDSATHQKMGSPTEFLPITDHPNYSMGLSSVKKCLQKESAAIEIFKTRTETKLFAPVVALPDGEGAVTRYRSNRWGVYKLNKFGHSIRELYSCTKCKPIRSLILLPENLLNIVHQNGLIVEISLKNYFVQKFKVNNVKYVINLGSLSPVTKKVSHYTLWFIERRERNIYIFSFNKNTKQKKVHATGFVRPKSVSHLHYAGKNGFVVCDRANHKVIIYNFSWNQILSFGCQGKKDGQLMYPTVAISLHDGNILVSDTSNNRVSEFLPNGTFLKHLLHITKPTSMSLYGHYLWINNLHGEVRKYQLNYTCKDE